MAGHTLTCRARRNLGYGSWATTFLLSTMAKTLWTKEYTVKHMTAQAPRRPGSRCFLPALR